MKLRSVDRDALRARRGFERAAASVDWTPPNLSSDAILLVRRLAACADSMPGRTFGERVSAELRRHAHRARRPWLHVDAREADAVIFVDEAELIACLVRDWLRGRVAEHWWWRTVLGGAGPYAWIRREAIARGDVLVAAMGRIACSGDAVAFVKRIEPVHCIEACAAVSRAHALVIVEPDREASAPTTSPIRRAMSRTKRHALHESERVDSIRRLVVEVPEAFAPALSAPQRRLLALALGLARMPGAMRSAGFAEAIGALEEMPRFMPPGAPSLEADRQPVECPRPPSDEEIRAARGNRETHEAAARPAHSDEAPRVPRRRSARVRPARIAHGLAPDGAPTPEVVAGHREESPPPGTTRAPEVLRHEPAEGAAVTSEERAPGPGAAIRGEPWIEATVAPPHAIESAPRTPTRFGGLFYLLNAALALGLYGDFTAPLAKNLELSPWDWLALVGREWFGDELREDAIWKLLAELAGRAPEEEADRDFHPPSKGWLAEHVASLRARIALALDTRQEDVPAMVCRHAAGIEVSASKVRVHFSLQDLPLEIRVAGLDRDPGWIPAAGRAVFFHFD